MALATGTTAPDFTLLDTDMKPVSLSSFRGQKVLVVFFPAAFTGVCKTELCSFQKAIQRLNGAGVQVLAISADLPFSNGAFRSSNDISFPLLSDWSLATIKAYDVEWPNFAGIEGLSRSARATFLVDANGAITFVDVTENPGVEPNYDEILAAIEA